MVLCLKIISSHFLSFRAEHSVDICLLSILICCISSSVNCFVSAALTAFPPCGTVGAIWHIFDEANWHIYTFIFHGNIFRNQCIIAILDFFLFFFFFFFLFFFFFDSVFTASQDYFSRFEPSQLLDGANTGVHQVPEKKTLDHLQAELGLSHMLPELGSNPQQWDDERFRALKISGLNVLTTRPRGPLYI